MTPSYVLDEQLDEAASYRVVASALLENSSAHGLPTLYRAQGDSKPVTYANIGNILSISLSLFISKRRRFVFALLQDCILCISRFLPSS